MSAARGDGADAASSSGEALRSLLSLEAHRAAAGFEPDPALLADGWEFRFVADAPRAAEAVQLYAELGFAVRAEPVHGRQIADACVTCQLVTALQFQAIYTRAARGHGSPRPEV